MTSTQVSAPVALRNVLYLTDFSASSEAALPFAVAVARRHAGSIEVLHVLTPAIPSSCPEAVMADEEMAQAEMRTIQSRIAGVACQTTIAEGMSVWKAIDRTIRAHPIDLIVAGTHGRTGLPKVLLGSVAEEVFRHSSVPVLTVGPLAGNGNANGTRFDRVLFATDFSPESQAAAEYALSFVRNNCGHLILLHVMPKIQARMPQEVKAFEDSVTKAIDRLYHIVTSGAALYNPPQVIVDYGDAAGRIVEVAQEQHADLIVLGVRSAAGHLGAATHLERAVAHKVVAHASCAVLTVRT